MTRFRALSLLAAVAGTLLVAVPAYADEIVLWSGERLTGRIVDKSNDALVLETASSENVRVAWDDIFSLQTDAPQDAMLTRNDSAPRIPMAEAGVAALAPRAPKTA